MSTKYNEITTDSCLWTWHPEMILVSKSPVILKGFLIIPNLVKFRVKLELIAPNYPLIQDAQINFGTAIALLRNGKFSEKMKELINSGITVPLFLTRLQSLIGEHLHIKHHENDISSVSLNNFMTELKTVLLDPSGVQVSCDNTLKTVKLSLNNISITLERNENTETPWKIISSDFPKIPAFERFETNKNCLNAMITMFKWKVELLEKAWEQLKEIDENCWVIDPLEPNKSHMHRRIHLSQSISVTIIIDPLKPTSLPSIKFSGSDSEVKKQTIYVTNNILKWDSHCSILENLRMLLNMYEFPEQQESVEDKNAIINKQDCGICFFAKSDTDKLPDKICENLKCMIHYHSVCLSKWLQRSAENQIVFGYIHGICPHCKEKISCCIRQ